MNPYRQSIAIFGFAIPFLIAVGLIAGCLLVKARITESFDQKIGHFKGFEQNKLNALSLEANVSKRREALARWNSLIDAETASVVTSNLREIEEKLPSKEFQKTAQEHPTDRSGFAAVSGQGAAKVRLAFRATFRSMQMGLLELETRMPQLQLEELRVDPSTTSNSLNFNVTYTAWEK